MKPAKAKFIIVNIVFILAAAGMGVLLGNLTALLHTELVNKNETRF
jgi:hypothetical protein